MAWNDLPARVQEGLNYQADTVKDGEGNPLYANGRAVMDALAVREGWAWWGMKMEARKARRAAKLELAENATLAAQVDALPDPVVEVPAEPVTP